MSLEWAFQNLPEEGAVAEIKRHVDEGDYESMIEVLEALNGTKKQQVALALEETYRFICDSGRRQSQEEAARIGKGDVEVKFRERYPDLEPFFPTSPNAKAKLWKLADLDYLPQARENLIKDL